MTDFLVQMGLSNACFSLALAIVATVVGARVKRPYLAHMLWLLVFVKLLTPPIVTIPVGMPSLNASNDDLSRETGPPDISEVDVETQRETALTAQAPFRLSNIVIKLTAAKPLLASLWLPGSFFIFAWSMRRVFRFIWLLGENTKPASRQLQTASATIAKQLELTTVPEILTTSAHLVPMVWWAGGKVRVVIPASLIDEMDASEWRWVLAHELAHVRRRDYLVRWLEWLACVWFWWNPVVWWAQRNLRQAEEICCDNLVLSYLKPKPRSYADSLLRAVEFLACPAIRPPAMASEINGGGFLERRFRMIVSDTTKRLNSRWSQACVLFCAMVVLPLGVVYAQDYDAVANRLKAAVKSGELTEEHAEAMLHTLKKTGDAKKVHPKKPPAKDKKEFDYEAFSAKVKAAVKAGVLTKEEAKAKLAATTKKVPVKKPPAKHKKDIDHKLEAFKEKLEGAVKAGVLTKEEAKVKLAATTKKVPVKKPPAKHKKDIDPKLTPLKKAADEDGK